MPYLSRALSAQVERAARDFPAVLLTGPRRAGKTTLLRSTFPNARYYLLEDPDLVSRLRTDPRGFLDGVRPPVVLDEVQNVPEILAYVRTRIDAAPRRRGQWLLTGSQEAPLMQGVSESMAGRVGVLQLLPFSTRESPKVTLLYGGFPEVLARPRARALWFSSYVQTYLERDVRAVTAIRDLATFRRFLGLVAARTGQMLNRSDIAAPLGVSVPTVSQWLSILEMTGQVLIVPPYFENFGKRLVKSPKVYVADSGLACHLLGIETEPELARSPFLGAIWEGFVASEVAKLQLNAGRRRELYYFRDQQGLEVDFVVPRPGGGRLLIEARASRTATPHMAEGVRRLSAAAGRVKGNTTSAVVYRPARDDGTTALSPGTEALSLRGLLDLLARRR
jgi:predicted AAA+ superfamily ATPase